jgi:chemotaxis methyl-accepting protein methylase
LLRREKFNTQKGYDSAISGYQNFDIIENKNFIKFYFLLSDRKNKIYQKFNNNLKRESYFLVLL